MAITKLEKAIALGAEFLIGIGLLANGRWILAAIDGLVIVKTASLPTSRDSETKK